MNKNVSQFHIYEYLKNYPLTTVAEQFICLADFLEENFTSYKVAAFDCEDILYPEYHFMGSREKGDEHPDQLTLHFRTDESTLIKSIKLICYECTKAEIVNLIHEVYCIASFAILDVKVEYIDQNKNFYIARYSCWAH